MSVNCAEFIKGKVKEIKRVVKDSRALAAVSGGVDSVTAGLLAHKALGPNLTVLFLDDGLMREGEVKEISDFYGRAKVELQIWDVSESFFEALKGKTDPEEKRKAFRDVFYKTLGQALKSYSADFLIQGTIAADVVETQKGIKTQHNVLSQIKIDPAWYGLKILEPLKELYKDEVRKVAKTLGLPAKFYERKPFPGPGLATRIIGEVTRERVEILRTATVIVEEELKAPSIFQAFPVLLNDKATGISPEGKRLLGDIIAIRAVQSTNALTAQPYKITWSMLEKIRVRIFKKLPNVVKVLYDITPKPPSTIEYI